MDIWEVFSEEQPAGHQDSPRRSFLEHFGLAHRNRRAYLSWAFCSQIAEISLLGEVILHSRFHDFHNCTLCREVLLLNFSQKSLPLVLELALFPSLP